jgi:chromate reductase, NAD(P)H dehydrogenase (quinone)
MPKLKVLTISGSLRAKSSNGTVLDALALLVPAEIEIVRYRDLALLPAFNPDTDVTPPPPADALRRAIGAVDALVISSPEYAHGIAGSLKNALDWLVGSLEFPGIPVGVINAAPRASHADAQLREILRMMSAALDERAMLTLPIQSRGLSPADIAADPALSVPLLGMLSCLGELNAARRTAAAAE